VPAGEISGPDLQSLMNRLEGLVAAGQQPDSWIHELAEAADRLRFPIAQLRSIATNLTRIARRLGQPVPSGGKYCGGPGTGGLVHLYSCGQCLLDLANTMIGAGEADGTVYFRRAMAYRMLGMFPAALDDIDHAFSMLPPGNNEIHQDYLRERQLIGVAVQSCQQQDRNG